MSDRSKRTWIAAAAAVLLLAAGSLVGFVFAKRSASPAHPTELPSVPAEAAEPVDVEVDTAALTTLPSYAEATGVVRARSTADVAPKIMSTVRSVAVREGDFVTKGQLLVTLEAADLQAQLAQAEASLRAADSQAQSARTVAQIQRSQSAVSIAQAQAALEAARQQLAIVKTGPRRQERAQARLQVAQAEAAFRNAEIEYQRMERLYKEEVVPKQRLDAARTQYEIAKAAYEAAQQQADLVEEGSRREEVRAAEEQVRSAEEALRLAKASAAQNEVREQQARAAAAEARRAAAALQLTRVTLGYSALTAPVSGLVVARHADPGDMVPPGQPILTIEETGSYRLEASVPESLLPYLRIGQHVRCTVDALALPKPPSKATRVLDGRVSEIVPAGDPNSHTFTVKADLPQVPGLKTGLFGRMRFPTDSRSAVTVPNSAVWERGGLQGVFIIGKDNRARVRLIKTGRSIDGRIEVASGLSDGDRVAATNVERLSDGTRVNVVASGRRASAGFQLQKGRA